MTDQLDDDDGPPEYVPPEWVRWRQRGQVEAKAEGRIALALLVLIAISELWSWAGWAALGMALWFLYAVISARFCLLMAELLRIRELVMPLGSRIDNLRWHLPRQSPPSSFTNTSPPTVDNS